MPNYKCHFLGGCVIYGIIFLIISLNYKACIFSFDQSILFFVATFLGSLFPDIDTRSKGRKIFYVFLPGIIILSFALKNFKMMLSVASFSALMHIVKHRGIFHTIWFNLMFVFLCCSGLINLVPYYKNNIILCGAFFLLGVFSHLFLDFRFKLKKLFYSR